MGLFSKKKQRERVEFVPLYKDEILKKRNVGVTTKKKSTIAISTWKRFLENHYQGVSNKDNLFESIKSLNFFHHQPFLRHKTNFNSDTKAYAYKIDYSKIPSFFPHIKKIISTGHIYEELYTELSIANQLSNYNFNTQIFLDDEYEYKLKGTTLEIVKDNYIPNFIKEYEFKPYIGNEPNEYKSMDDELNKGDIVKDGDEFKVVTKITMQLTKIRLPIGTKRDIKEFDVIAYIPEFVDEVLNVKLLEEIKKTYGDREYNIAQVDYDIIDDSGEKAILEVNGKVTWEGHLKTEDELKTDEAYQMTLEIKRNFEGKLTSPNPSDVMSRDQTKEQIKKLDRLLEDIKIKYEDVSFEVKLDKKLVEIDDKLNNENNLFIEGITYSGDRVIEVFNDYHKLEYRQELNIKLATPLPIKGYGVPFNDDKLKHKYWRIAMERAGYKNKLKRVKSKKDKNDEADIYTQIQNIEQSKACQIGQCLDMRYFFKDEVRSDKSWIAYLSAIMHYLDDLVRFNDSEFKELIVNTPWNTEFASKSIVIPKECSMRIRGAKRVIKDIKITKACDMQVIDGKIYLFLDEKNYSYSTLNERDQGIYKAITRYILDMSFWYELDREYLDGAELFKKLTKKDDDEKELSEREKYVESIRLKGYSLDGIIALHKHDYEYEICGDKRCHTYSYIGMNIDNSLDTDETIKNRELLKFDNKGYPKSDEITTIDKIFSKSELSKPNSEYLIGYQRVKGKLHRVIYVIPKEESIDIKALMNKKVSYNDRGEIERLGIPKYIPLMPTKLWYKVPWFAKQDVVLSTLIITYKLTWTEKKGTFFSKIFGIVLVIVGVAINTFSGGSLSWLGNMMIGSGIGYTIAQTGNKLLMTIYAIYSAITGGLQGVSALNNGQLLGGVMQTAGSIATISSTINNLYQTSRMEASQRDFENSMNSLESESKKEAEKRLNDDLKGINLNNYDVKAEFDEDIDWYFYVAYGNLLWNHFENYYNSMMTKYNEEYDRFK